MEACQLTFIPGEPLAAYSCFSIVLSATPGRRRQLVRAQIGPALHDRATLGGRWALLRSETVTSYWDEKI